MRDPRRRGNGWILAGLILLVLAFAAWGTWWQDWDFYRPTRPLQCSSSLFTEKPVRFIAFGDYGQGTPFQMQLAKQMVKTHDQTPFDTVLLLGDNIYGDGDIKRLAKPYFEKPYGPLIQRNVRFLAAIGNHDTRKGHMKDQMEYFKMPNDFYKVSKGPVDFFILNTTFFVRNPKQQQWLEKSLSESKAPWKIVAGHHPLYSSGRNGNTEGLRAILEPMLQRHGVTLYLCGHDHDYERFKPIHNVHYIVSGGGGGFLTSFRDILPESQVHLRTHHFVMVEATATDIWLKAINRHGEVIDCDHWRKTSAH